MRINNIFYESFDEEILSPEWAKSKLLELGLKCIDIEYTEYMLAGELIEKYKASKGRFMWYYPVSDKTNPELPADLLAFTKFIHI